MELYILNPQYEIIGIVDEAQSVLWDKKYTDAGYCEIYIPYSADMFALLSRGNYVYRYDDDMFCRIETNEIETDIENGDYIIATATDISKPLLSGRIVRWNTVYSGTVLGFIEKLLTDNVINPAQERRRISNFSLHQMTDAERSEFTEKINVTANTDELFALIQATCKQYNYGFRTSYDVEAHRLVFRLYKGKNRASAGSEEYIEFSPTVSNILSSHYKEDDSEFRNIVYVGYKADDETEALLSVYDGMDDGMDEPSGENRREVYIDATGTSRDITLEELEALFGEITIETKHITAEDSPTTIIETYYSGEIIVARAMYQVAEMKDKKIQMTDYTYITVIRNTGNNELANHRMSKEFDGEIDTDYYEYKKDYDIGDIVKVEDKFGISANARIVSIMESDDDDRGHIVEPVFEYLS